MTQPEVFTHRTPRVVAARKLLHRKYRNRQRQFLVEGPQALSEAVRISPTPLSGLFCTEAAARRYAGIANTARSRGVAVWLVTEHALATLTQTATPQGLVGVCDFIDVPADRVDWTTQHLVVVAAGIAEPGNAGALIRVADAAGAQTVIFADDSVDPYNDKSVRAAAGSLFHPTIVRSATAEQIVHQAKTAGLLTLATSGYGSADLFALADAGTLDKPTVWLFGNEANGLPPALAARCDYQVAIPIYGQAESLNLATAAAICVYASARERASSPRRAAE